LILPKDGRMLWFVDRQAAARLTNPNDETGKG
jgi:hypothetical protein